MLNWIKRFFYSTKYLEDSRNGLVSSDTLKMFCKKCGKAHVELKKIVSDTTYYDETTGKKRGKIITHVYWGCPDFTMGWRGYDEYGYGGYPAHGSRQFIRKEIIDLDK